MIEHNNIDKTVETLNSLNYDLFIEDGRDYVSKGRIEDLNLLILSDKSEFGKSHAGVRNSLWENGVLNCELLDNYVIKYYNPKGHNPDGNGFCEVDYSQVKMLDDVYNFFGIKRDLL